jgi:gamma-glutamylputrescine oxidase
MTTPLWARTHNYASADLSCDVAIIGAGFIGLSTALWLTEYRPDLKIIVLDSSTLGAGASGRNAGFLTKGSATFYKNIQSEWGMARGCELYQFAKKSLQLVHEKILKCSPEIKFEKTSSLTMFQTEEHWRIWNQQLFSLDDYEFRWLDRGQLPPALSSKYFGGLENSIEYKLNPAQFLKVIKDKLLARKVVIHENMSAFALADWGIRTEVNNIRAKKVVLALNGYLPQFHDFFKAHIFPKRAQMMAVELEKSLGAPSLYYDSHQRVYWREVQDNLLIIGGKRLMDDARESNDFDKNSTMIQAALEQYLTETLAIKYKIIQRWSGIMGFTESELPIVTKAITAPIPTYIIGGFSGHGMGLGFAAAQEISEIIIGKKETSFFDSFKSIKIDL